MTRPVCYYSRSTYWTMAWFQTQMMNCGSWYTFLRSAISLANRFFSTNHKVIHIFRPAALHSLIEFLLFGKRHCTSVIVKAFNRVGSKRRLSHWKTVTVTVTVTVTSRSTQSGMRTCFKSHPPEWPRSCCERSDRGGAWQCISCETWREWPKTLFSLSTTRLFTSCLPKNNHV